MDAVTQINITPALVEVLNRCRYGVYACIFVILYFNQANPAAAWTLLTWCSLGFVSLFPLLTHVLLGVDRLRKTNLVIVWHCIELAIILLIVISHPQIGTMAYAIGLIFLASSAALFGRRILILQLALSLLVYGVLVKLTDDFPGFLFQSIGPVDALTLDLAKGLLLNSSGLMLPIVCVSIYVLLICLVAHAQALQLLQVQVQQQHDKQRLLHYLPTDLAKTYKRQQPGEVRHEWMTIVFIDLADFSRTTENLPSGQLHQLVNNFVGRTHRLVEQWGGYVSKFLGDGVLCVFTPSGTSSELVQRENTALQAIKCVMLLPGLMSEVGQDQHIEIRARIGIASGYCAIGAWGDGGRVDHTVIGAPVNLAARLQNMAHLYGGALLDQETAALVVRSVSLGVEEVVDVKGMGPHIVRALEFPVARAH